MFVFVYSGMEVDTRVMICNIVVVLIIEGFSVNIVYFFFRTYNFYHHYVWKTFVRSDMFKINYTLEHLEWTK